jgi:phosphoribosylformimino-5-aminoimidazole carboxamide ribotide isomerase
VLVVPAIDLKAGRCVRLREGRMETATIYAEDPAEQARLFLEAGAHRIHVVDLDGAFSGRPENAQAVRAIAARAKAKGVEVEVGGGMRDEATVEAALDHGASFVILGTMLVKDPDRFGAIARAHPGRVIAGIDAKDGEAAIDGWAVRSGERALDLAHRAEKLGASAIIYTDIGRDGLQTGVNAEATDRIAGAVSIPVFASGGVGSLEDLARLKRTKASGVIIGRALYEGSVDLKAAIEAVR